MSESKPLGSLAYGFHKCQICSFVGKPQDLINHLKTHQKWRPTKSGSGETIFAVADPVLAAKLKENTVLHENGYIYKVYGERIWRRREIE